MKTNNWREDGLITTKECNVLHNRCDCMNRVHEYTNEVAPKLLDALRHGFRLTNGYQLFSKDKDRLQDILRIADELKAKLSSGSSGRKGSSAYLRSDEYNIYLEVQDNYPIRYHGAGGGYTCEYYKKTVYLWNNKVAVKGLAVDFKPLPLHTHVEFENAKAEIEVLEAGITAQKNQLYPLKRLIGE